MATDQPVTVDPPVGADRRADRVADVEPLDVDGTRTVAVGALLWLAALVLLLVFFRDWLRETDREWWLWTCVTGVALGVGGTVYCRWRRRRRGSAPVS